MKSCLYLSKMTHILFVHVHALLAAIGTFALVTHCLQSKNASIWINMNSESGHLVLWGRCRRSLARGMITLYEPLWSRPLHDLAWPRCPQVSVSEIFWA